MNLQKRLKELKDKEIQLNTEINRANNYLQNANRTLLEIIGAIKELTSMEEEGKKDGKNRPNSGSKSKRKSK